MEELYLFPKPEMDNMITKGIKVIEKFKTKRRLEMVITDVEYFQRNLTQSLKTPKEYMG